MGLTIGLDTAVTALRAAQVSLDTAAHNISNAGTDGYSRQAVDFRAIPPVRDGSGGTSALAQVGRGVDSGRVMRLRDTLVDTQYRDARRARDGFQAEATALSQAEVILNEPSDQGIQAQLTNFFNAFRDLATKPESVAARAAAVETGATLAAAFVRAHQMLLAQRNDIDASLDVKVSDINAKAHEIADLNAQIRMATVGGGAANDLYDRRDLIIDDLSGLIGVTVQPGTDNTIDVYIGNRKLVDDITANDLATTPDPANGNLRQVVWAADSAPAMVAGGAVAGIITARDVHVAGLLTSLDQIAGALIAGVNAHHAAGYGLDNSTGLPYFTGTDAATIAVNPTLLTSPESLATSDVINEPGNPNIARAIANVQSELLMGSGTTTVDDSYRSMIARLGVASQQASMQADNQSLLTDHLETARQSVSGVSIDEEMTNIIKAQHAYQAAARIISTVDSILDTLINRT